MKHDIKIRPYKFGDEYQIVRLLNLVFGNWPKFDLSCDPIDHWRWKTAEGPLGENNIYIAKNRSEMVGTETRIVLKAKIGNNIQLCEQRVDLAVNRDFRGNHIFSKITGSLCEKSLDRGVKLSYAVQGNPIGKAKYRQLGAFTPSNKIIRLFFIKDVERFITARNLGGSIFYKICINFIKFLNKMNTHRIKLKEKFEGKITDSYRFDDRFEHLWTKISEDYEYILLRDKNFLKWRYGDQRAGKYHVKIAKTSSELLGYAVLRINKNSQNYPVGYIVDLLALPNHLNAVEALVRESVNFFMNKGVNEILYWVLKNHPYAKCLQKYGFFHLPPNPYIDFFCYQNNPKTKRLFGKTSRIYFSLGDSDMI